MNLPEEKKEALLKESEKELLIAILKSNLSPKFKEEILRVLFLPRITHDGDINMHIIDRKEFK